MQTKKHINSFDGVRVIALLGVVLFHINSSIFKGGYLGVVTFFVMAGYLTINKAMQIGEEDNRFKLVFKSIKDKFLKLYPPLIFMIFLVSVFIFFFFRADLGGIANDIKSSLLSINNYAQIFAGDSYFENTGKLAPFTHIWALSLEVQVYILIFIFFYGTYKPTNKKYWFSILFLMAILSYALSTYLIYSGADLNRVYYSAETRLYSFCLGGMAALISIKKENLPSKSFNEFLIFILLFASIGAFFIFDVNNLVFYYIFPLYSLIIALLMILLRDSEGYQSKILSSSPFSLLSKRSYHLYLWHFPIIALQEKMMSHTIISNTLFYLIFLVTTLIFSEISYRGSVKISQLQINNNRKLAIILLLSLMIFNFPYKLIGDNSQGKQELEEMKNTILENELIQKEEAENHEDTQETEFTYGYYKALDFIEWVNDLGDESLYLDPDEYTKYRHTKGILIGDSLASMSYHTLATYMPNLIYDTDHSREMKDAFETYTSYEDQDKGDYIILSLGANGDVLHEDMDKIRKDGKDKSIILNTIVLPYKLIEEERNASIRSYEALHDDVYLCDWYAAMKDKPDFFFDDKIHVGERGAKIMGQLIMKKIIEIEKESSLNRELSFQK